MRVGSDVGVGVRSDDKSAVGVGSDGADADEHAAISAPTMRKISIRFCMQPHYNLKRREREIRDCRFLIAGGRFVLAAIQ